MVKRQSHWRSECWFVSRGSLEHGGPTERLNTEDILICRWTEKSMLRCFILFKRCRTCRSQSRCWTCGRRGTFSTSWGWRARSKGCGQSSDRSNRTGRRSSTKTFRYSFLFDVELWKELHREKAAELSPSKDTWEASELINFHSRMRLIRVYRHPAEDGTVWHGV